MGKKSRRAPEKNPSIKRNANLNSRFTNNWLKEVDYDGGKLVATLITEPLGMVRVHNHEEAARAGSEVHKGHLRYYGVGPALMLLEMRMHGKCIPQPRVRVANRGGFATAYVPQDHPIHDFKHKIRQATRNQIAKRGDRLMYPIAAPICVDMVFALKRSGYDKSHDKGFIPSITMSAGDIDNLEKAVLDGLNGLIWEDDKWVFAVNKCKRSCMKDEEPSLLLRIYRWIAPPKDLSAWQPVDEGTRFHGRRLNV